MEWHNQVAVVTGGARGLGRATARRDQDSSVTKNVLGFLSPKQYLSLTGTIDQLYLVAAYLAGGVHRAVPSNQNRQAAVRQPMAARNQARRLPHHCPQEQRAGEALQPSGQRFTHCFPPIVETLARLRSHSCIIDGEAVVTPASSASKVFGWPYCSGRSRHWDQEQESSKRPAVKRNVGGTSRPSALAV